MKKEHYLKKNSRCNLMNKSREVKTSRKPFTLLTRVCRQLHSTLMNCGRAREIEVKTSIGQELNESVLMNTEPKQVSRRSTDVIYNVSQETCRAADTSCARELVSSD